MANLSIGMIPFWCMTCKLGSFCAASFARRAVSHIRMAFGLPFIYLP